MKVDVKMTPSGSVMILALLLLIPSLSLAEAPDWSLQCPSSCRCTWVGGRKQVTCDLSAEPVQRVPRGLSSEVQVLDLSGSLGKLENRTFQAVGLVNLQKLFLDNCGITHIDQLAFFDLTILIELQLSNNRLEVFDPSIFQYTERLRELKLNGNPLKSFSGDSHFPPLLYLKLVDISDCELAQIKDKTFDQLSGSLEVLNLAGNRFTNLGAGVVRNLRRLKALSLHGNPWDCNCRLRELKDFIMAKDKNLYQLQTKCAEPPHLKNFQWSSLTSNDFACKPEILHVQIQKEGESITDIGPSTKGDLSIQEGSWVKVSCLISGEPVPESKWVRNGEVLGPPEVERGYGEEDRVWMNLTINGQTSDLEEYTCSAENPAGIASRTLKMKWEKRALILPGTFGFSSEGGWVWLVILIIVAALLIIAFLCLGICFCLKRKNNSGSKNEAESGPQEHLLSSLPVKEDKDGEKEMAVIAAEPTYAKISPSTPPPPSLTPDLLDLPHSRVYGRSPTPSYSCSDSSHRLLLSPIARASPYPQPAHVPFTRPGYVTLPRRTRGPSWSSGPPSPSLSINTVSLPFPPPVKYDNMGPRTTADGSSRLSLNNLPGDGAPRPHVQPHVTSTLGRYGNARDGLGQAAVYFHPRPVVPQFEPIQEVELDTTKTEQNKKVPPQPPPKPKKKKAEDRPEGAEGDDGTEV